MADRWFGTPCFANHLTACLILLLREAPCTPLADKARSYQMSMHTILLCVLLAAIWICVTELAKRFMI